MGELMVIERKKNQEQKIGGISVSQSVREKLYDVLPKVFMFGMLLGVVSASIYYIFVK